MGLQEVRHHAEPRKALTPLHFAFADALRATAILVVFGEHLISRVIINPVSAAITNAMGYWAVDAFFVLSGFLLGRPYIDAILGKRSLPRFDLYARRRFLRIWPAYIVVVLIGTLLTNLHHGKRHISLADMLAHLTMVHNLFLQYISGAGNSALWTMAVDGQFYLALPIFAWWLTFGELKSQRRQMRKFFIYISAISLLGLSWRIYVSALNPKESIDFVNSTQRGLVGMSACFCLGSLLALMQSEQWAIPRKIAELLFAAGLVLMIASFTSIFWVPAVLSPYLPTILDVVGALSVTSIIAGGTQLRSVIESPAINGKIVRGVAANAYALYLIHMPIVYVTLVTLESHHILPGTIRFAIIFLIGCILCSISMAYILHRFVEQPFLSIKERSREILTT